MITGIISLLTACAEPPRSPAPLEVGRSSNPSATSTAPKTTAKSDQAPKQSEEIIFPRPSAETSIIISTDTPSDVPEDIDTAAPQADLKVVLVPKDNQSVVQTSLPEVTLPAPISPDVVMPEEVEASEDDNMTAKLVAEIAEVISEKEASEDATKDTSEGVSDEAEELSSDSLLGEEALEAAFSLLSSRAVKNVDELELFAPRVAGEFRVGVMLPFTGPYAALGVEIANGAELALFQLKLPDLNLIYIDTKAGENASQAVAIAKKADLDLVIGPLFSESIASLQPNLSELSLTALTLSNNRDVAAPNSWVLGNLPEQQIDLLIAKAIEAGDRRFAVMAADDIFGQRVLQHTLARLKDFGISPAEVMILGPDRLDEEQNLRAAVKQFARYQKPDDTTDATLLPAPYDSLILAGLPRFLLRVAPVLDYYDLGPDRVHYLGTDLWDRPELLTEPSLQDAYVAVLDQPDDTGFKALWAEVHDQEPSNFAKLGFDVLAVGGTLKSQVANDQDWARLLAREQGFSGFTGNFRLLPDGTNARNYIVKQIVDTSLKDVEGRLTVY